MPEQTEMTMRPPKLGMQLPEEALHYCRVWCRRHGFGAFQVFVSNARKYQMMPVPDVTSELEGIVSIIHAPFIIYVASNDRTWARRSVGILKGVMQAAEKHGADYVVLHPGSGKSIERLADVAQYIAGLGLKPKLLYETDCGSKKNTRLGRLENLMKVRELVSGDVGICLDTAHMFASGELVTSELIERVKPDVIHLNEPEERVKMGGHLDRHNVPFGDGHFGVDFLTEMAQYADRIPVILEADMAVSFESLRRGSLWDGPDADWLTGDAEESEDVPSEEASDGSEGSEG